MCVCVCACSSDVSVLEEALSTAAVVLSRASDLDGWDMFQDLFSFLCLLLDNKLASEAGQGLWVWSEMWVWSRDVGMVVD